MTQRNKHLNVVSDEPVFTCFVCGTENGRDAARKYYRFKPIGDAKSTSFVICEECEEDCKAELAQDDIFGNSDTLTSDGFDQILEWGLHTAIMSFTETQNQVQTLEQVREFFSVLSVYLIWHPDTSFKDYVSQPKGKDGATIHYENKDTTPTFTETEALALDNLMQDCFTITRKFNADIYELAQASLTLASDVTHERGERPNILGALKIAKAHIEHGDAEEAVSMLELLVKNLGQLPSEELRKAVYNAHNEESIGSVEKAEYWIDHAIVAFEQESKGGVHWSSNGGPCVFCGVVPNTPEWFNRCAGLTSHAAKVIPAPVTKPQDQDLLELLLDLVYEACKLIPDDVNEAAIKWHEKVMHNVPSRGFRDDPAFQVFAGLTRPQLMNTIFAAKMLRNAYCNTGERRGELIAMALAEAEKVFPNETFTAGTFSQAIVTKAGEQTKPQQ